MGDFAPDASLQLCEPSASAVNFLLGYLMLWRGRSRSSLAASAGAFIFAFGGSRLSQNGPQRVIRLAPEG